MNLKQFNLIFLAALDFIDPKARLIAEGTGGKHPNLRYTLLKNCREDIKQNGFDYAYQHWQYFIEPTIRERQSDF